MLGTIIPRFNDKNWWPGILLSSVLFTLCWGYLVFTGNVSSIWPLFGISNQLLAACGLIVCTTMLIRLNRGKYALYTAIPGVFMAIITFWAGYLQVIDIYIPQEQYLLAVLAIFAMLLMSIVFFGAFRRWHRLLSTSGKFMDHHGEEVKQLVDR